MEIDFPSVIIDSTASSTKAGLSTFDTPSIVLPSVYSRKSVDSGEYIFGDELDDYPENEIFTMFSDGVVYNWEALAEFWKYIYAKLSVNPEELPLIVTENAWSLKKNKVKACQIAFEELKVPIFSILKRQLCISFAVSKPTFSTIIDIDDDLISVTPISNGKVLSKGITHTKFGGNFLDLFVMEFIRSKFSSDEASIEGLLTPREFKDIKMSDSFKMYQISNTLKDFKTCLLQTSLYPIQPQQTDLPSQSYSHYDSNSSLELKNYELPNRKIIKDIEIEQYKLTEPLFRPEPYATAYLPHLKVAEDSEGLSELILTAMKSLEGPTTMYVDLLKNIVFSGSVTHIPSIDHRVMQDLRRIIPDYPVKTHVSPDIIERHYDAWVGANILTSSSVGDFDTLFVSKDEYEENGEDYIIEKFK